MQNDVPLATISGVFSDCAVGTLVGTKDGIGVSEEVGIGVSAVLGDGVATGTSELGTGVGGSVVDEPPTAIGSTQ